LTHWPRSVNDLGTGHTGLPDDLSQFVGRFLVHLRRVEIAAAEKGHATRFEHAIDFLEAFGNVGDEGQRAATDDRIGVIFREWQLLGVTFDERNAVLKARFTNPVLEQRSHVRVDVESNDSEFGSLGKLHVEIASAAPDVDADAIADAPQFAEDPHGGHGIGVLEAILDDPVEGLGVGTARHDRETGLRFRPQSVSHRTAQELHELRCLRMLANNGCPDGLASRMLPGDPFCPVELSDRWGIVDRIGHGHHKIADRLLGFDPRIQVVGFAEFQMNQCVRSADVLRHNRPNGLFDAKVRDNATNLRFGCESAEGNNSHCQTNHMFCVSNHCLDPRQENMLGRYPSIAGAPIKMRQTMLKRFLTTLVLTFAATATAAGTYHEVSYPPSTEPGELQFGVTYTLWIPGDVERIRGVIVHQHGCGDGACRGGATAAYDLHWQALARKWDCALLGPSYQQGEHPNCRLWCDPRNGSGDTFLKALDDLAEKSDHPEVATAPWCLWGHSGGGFWASLMQVKHPQRIVAIWNRSGTAFSAWESGEIPKPKIPEAAFAVPVMCNPGVKEKEHERFHRAWDGCLAMFEAYRAKGAPIGFAPDPRTSHECGDCRYLAIPFFDACLAMRLSDEDSTNQDLKPIDWNEAWYADVLGAVPLSAGSYRDDQAKAVWLPNKRVAQAWAEYVKTGAVGDTTPPPPPRNVRTAAQADGSVRIAWEADADLESGIGAFAIERDGKVIAQVPEKPAGRFGRPLFQRMSYHDTPEAPLPAMEYVDTSVKTSDGHAYRVVAVNSVGLRSEPSPPASGR
jgi:hypothetical protein